jgi:DNA-binding NarL/FixJ family response regulator
MGPADKITVLLVDDHAPVRQGLRTVLEHDVRIRVVAEARDGREAVELARKLRPKVILMDISMPVMNGLEATGAILSEQLSAKVVILSAQDDEEYVDRARAVGAIGYVSKQRAAEVLIHVIHEAAAGRMVFGTTRAAAQAGRGRMDLARKGSESAAVGALTAEDSALLKLVAQRIPKREIAARHHTKIATIERRIRALMEKLGIPTLLKLVEYGVASGYIDNDVEVIIV